MATTMDLKSFWQRLQTGVEVAVAGQASDKLLGARDGFLRFFHDGLDRTVSVAVVPQPVQEEPVGLLVTDEEVVREARRKAMEMETRLGGTYHFYIASEGGSIPWRVRARSSSFCNLSVTHELCKGCLIADVPAIVGSLDVVMGEIDR